MVGMTNESGTQPYAHPPIVEAILEVRFASEVNEAKLRKAHDFIEKRYSDSKTELQVEAKMDFAGRTAAFADRPPVYRLTSLDQTDACVLGNKSVAWVRRAPYEGWTPFCQRVAEELIIIFKALGGPGVNRIGLRYVNRIDVPYVDHIAHYEDYLNFKINHTGLLEPTLIYQWLVVKEFPDTKLKAIVQSAVVEPEIPSLAAFSFDIDIACEVEVPQKADDILLKLEAMRTLKNTIFEAGITDRARELYA